MKSKYVGSKDWVIRFLQIGDYYTQINDVLKKYGEQYSLLTKSYYNVAMPFTRVERNFQRGIPRRNNPHGNFQLSPYHANTAGGLSVPLGYWHIAGDNTPIANVGVKPFFPSGFQNQQRPPQQ